MMPFNYYFSQVTIFFSHNLWVGFVLAVVILFFLYKKTATCIKCIGLFGGIVVLFYIMTLLGNSTSDTATEYSMKKANEAVNELESN